MREKHHLPFPPTEDGRQKALRLIDSLLVDGCQVEFLWHYNIVVGWLGRDIPPPAVAAKNNPSPKGGGSPAAAKVAVAA